MAVAVLLCAAAVAAFVGTVVWMVSVAEMCTPDYSESTIIAPDSYRGQLLCAVTSDGELIEDTAAWVVLGLLPALPLGAACASWVRRGRVAAVAWLAVVAIAVPWVVHACLLAVPADCTAAQERTHGPAGCERNEELRPGLSVY